MNTVPTVSAREILGNADTHVTKIGGNNAGNLKTNAENVREKIASGTRQMVTVSAIRSSDDRYTAYADPDVSDTDANGNVKPGFNTTSHLIAVAKLLQSGDDPNRAQAIATSIGNFTRTIVEQQIAEDDSLENPDALRKEMDAIIARHIDGAEEGSLAFDSINSSGPQNITCDGEDWIWKRGNTHMSVTGLGEELAREIYQAYFRAAGIASGALDIREETQSMYDGILSRETHASDQIDTLRRATAACISALCDDNDVLIAGGYMPALGSRRGYSDQTGALVAAAAQSSGQNTVYVVEKDYPIMSADPTRYPDAKTVQEMTYFLAKELFGNTRGANGQALHPDALDILAEAGINTVVLNPNNPTNEHMTVIHHFDPEVNGVEIVASKAVPFALQITAAQMIDQKGFEAAVADWFSSNGISIQHIATSESTLSYTFYEGEYDEKRIDGLREFLLNEFGLDASNSVDVRENVSVIYCLGNNMHTPGQASKATEALQMEDIDIKLITQGLNGCVMTFLVDRHDAERAVQSLHDLLIMLPNDVYDDLRAEYQKKLRTALEEHARRRTS